MKALDEIKIPVKAHLSEFESAFKQSMKSSVPLLNRITHFLVKRKGKQIRPLFVFLSAGAAGAINASTQRAAILIELLHTATLIHDDVVDDSNERRGTFSLNALWKNKISVLVGDFLLSKGLLLSMDNSDYELLRIVSNATREMSEGELLQIEKARRLDIEESVYFEIIRKKTASLIASCCASGAASSGCSPGIVKKFHEFGELTGIAFQIKDDLFDYNKNGDTGKPTGVDLKEKKLTLPIIYLLQQSDWMEKRRIIHIIKNQRNQPDKVNELLEKVKTKGGIAYAEKRMMDYCEQAIDLLRTFPESEYRNSLEQLVVYTTERRK